jgi:hypothetical protein
MFQWNEISPLQDKIEYQSWKKKWYRFICGEGSDLGAYSFIIKMEADCSFKKIQ